MMQALQKSGLLIAVCAILLSLYGTVMSQPGVWQPAIAVGSVAVAFGIGAIPMLAGMQFTAWILAAVVVGMTYPETVVNPGPLNLLGLEIPELNLRNKWLILAVVQLVMFGMGTKMSLQDFRGVAKMPYPVFIGIGLQFLIMPLSGFLLAKTFGLPDEIAAGVVLIGSCSSGLASNVMCYMAGANLPLSITLTSIATLLAPLATPFWMSQLAGEEVHVDPWAMSLQIVKIVLLPIGAALLHDYLQNAASSTKRLTVIVLFFVAFCLLGLAFIAWQMPGTIFIHSADTDGIDLSAPVLEWSLLLTAAILVALTYHFASAWFSWIEGHMHVLSMAGIIFFTAITTAAGRDNLLTCGVALLIVAMLHNLAGYTFGYGLSRLAGLDKTSALTVAFEVGMQNGGMASGLAAWMNKLGTVGLAAAVFSPWMNVSGSLLANFVKNKGKDQQSEKQLCD